MKRPSGGGRAATDSAVEVESLVSRSFELEDVSFGAVLDAGERARVGWATPDGLEVAGCGVAVRFTASGHDRFETIRTDAERVFGGLDHAGPDLARPRAFGGFSFHDVPNGRDDDRRVDPWKGFDAATFVIPRVQVTRTNDGSWVTVLERDDEIDAVFDRWRERVEDLPAMRSAGTAPGIAETTRTTDRDEWTTQVASALERIERGDLEKVVLAQALTADLEGAVDVPATLERLRRRYPNCYRFTVDHGSGRTFFGAPPERLAAKRGDTLDTEALAGSVPRGETPEEDDAHLERMLESEKLRREHELVVDAIGTQLAPLARDVTVADRTVRRLATIQHLQTPISADLEPGRHVLDVVEALHPTPAVGGVPQATACETIRSVETFDRGWYAAPIGWFDGRGDGEFAVGIRSGVAADRSVTLFGGNGIVADSDPDDEWEEVQLKFRPILDELR